MSPELLRLAAQDTQHIKARSYELMRIRPGQTVLDAGCGAGTDLPALRHFVGENGCAIGCDHDPEMVTASGGVLGSLYELPFPDRHFHAVRCERVFQHLEDPVRALRELHRVTKKLGYVVVVDTDWTSFTVDCPERALERRISGFVASEGVASPWAARSLQRAFCEVGFHHVETETTVLRLSGEEVPGSPMEEIENRAVSQQVLTHKEIARWREYRQRAVQDGTYYATVNVVLTSGRVRLV